MTKPSTRGASARGRAIEFVRDTIAWADRKVPLGIRTLLGLIVAIGGVFGFLPVLGFWMIPLGLGLIALDIPPLRRRLIKKVAAEIRSDDADGKSGYRHRDNN